MGLRTKFIIISAGLIVLSFTSWFFYSSTYNQDNKEKPPNILLISLDACRADHLSCYGYQRQTAPFLDELALQGTRFENAFINSLGTPSSHTTMLTSLYEQTHSKDFWNTVNNIVNEKKPLPKGFFFTVPENITMLQEVMQKNGYSTISVTGGKIFKLMKFDRGFDEFEYTSEVSGIESGAEKLITLIKEYSRKDKPIFAFFHTYQIHTPYVPPEKYRTIFGTYKGNIEPTGENLYQRVNDAAKLSKSDLEYITMMYDAGIRYTDDVLRRMFAGLEKLGFFNNCLVLVTADHGEEFGEHGGLLHRNILFDVILHVPLIAVGRTIPKGRIDKRLVNTIDLMPTIASFAGIKLNTPVQGKALLNEHMNTNSKNEMVFAQNFNLQYSVRTHEWKLIESPGSSRLELYNLYKDPGELNEISKEHPELCKKLQNAIANWRANLLELSDIKKEEIHYSTEDMEKLRTLGYVH